jgi:EAL domain-containing protein (putative c-di-GMP-specific phosphodiesterase class I)
MRNFVDWLHEIEPPERKRHRAHQTDRVPAVLCDGELKVVYQPIVDFSTRKVFAHEALVRSTSKFYKGPPALIDDAIEAEFGGALGRAVRELAVANSPEKPLFVNIHPSEFDEGWLVQPDDPIFTHSHDVYLEITESVPLSHFLLCQSVLTEVRARGVMLAVDDLGAGYSNLKYIADLSPEIVKLDRGLIIDLSPGTRRFKLVRALVRLCEDMDSKVIAEGIETPEEANAVMMAGVHYGQGYLFARPAFPAAAPDFSLLTGT